MLEYLCDNIGLVLVCLLCGSTDVTTSPSRYMTQPSGIPILSPVLFMHVGDPYIPLLEFCLASFFSFIQTGSNLSVYATSSFLHSITMRSGRFHPCTCNFSNVTTLQLHVSIFRVRGYYHFQIAKCIAGAVCCCFIRTTLQCLP